MFLLSIFLYSLIKIVSSDENIWCQYIQIFNISEDCSKQMQIVCQNPTLFWGMYDASSKFLAPGISYGNNYDFGNFPECLSIEYQDKNVTILGKYCGLSVVVTSVFPSPDLENISISSIIPPLIPITNLNKVSISNTINGEDIPYPFAVRVLSLCIPNACTPEEVGQFYILDFFLGGIIMQYPDIICETNEPNPILYSRGVSYMITFLSFIVIFVAASTFYDYRVRQWCKKSDYPICLSFSLITNVDKLFSLAPINDQIGVFNGLRFFSLVWILSYHSAIGLLADFIPIINGPDQDKWMTSLSSFYILSAPVAVDTFIFLSGILLSYGYIKHYGKTGILEQIKGIPVLYLNRYLRLTPAAAAAFFVMITIFPLLGSGPLWTAITSTLADTCRKYWWSYLLHLQNYVNPDEMCINPTWYISADMQLFLISPFILIPTSIGIRKSFKFTVAALIILVLLTTTTTMLLQYYFLDPKNVSYATHDRLSVFFIGLIFGIILRKTKDHPSIFSSRTNIFLWIFTTGCGLFITVYSLKVNLDDDLMEYTLFNGLSRPIWCIFLGFITYSCCKGQGGIINRFLSNPFFMVYGRITYSVYILHFLVEIYIAASLPTPEYFSNYFLFYYSCGHFITTSVLGIFWTLFFEMPVINISKVLLKKIFIKKKKNKEESLGSNK